MSARGVLLHVKCPQSHVDKITLNWGFIQILAHSPHQLKPVRPISGLKSRKLSTTLKNLMALSDDLRGCSESSILQGGIPFCCPFSDMSCFI